MRVISVDLETTGLDPETCQIIEIGMAVDELSTDKIRPLAHIPTFQTYVLRGRYEGSAYALNMNAKLLWRIATKEPGYQYLWPGEAARAMAEFLKPHLDDRGQAVVVGKNFASFDLAFLRADKSFKDVVPMFKHRSIDIGNLFMHPGDKEPPGMEECQRRADAVTMVGALPGAWQNAIVEPNPELKALWFNHRPFVEHNALDDALQALYCLRCWYWQESRETWL